jgi:hypothetical protein
MLTDSRTACQILMKATEGDRHNKMAMRILKVIQNAQKTITIKWIPAHVGLERNEKADILAKDGPRNGTPIDYSLQLKDVYRILEQTQREEWNNWYVLKAAEKRKVYFELEPKIVVQKHETIKCRHMYGKQNNRNAHIHTKLAGKNGSNRGGVRSLRRRNGITTHFIHLHEIHQAKANMRLPRQTNTTESNIRKRRHSSVGKNNNIYKGHQNGRLRKKNNSI